MQLLGISGSLRKNSYNTGLLRAAAELLPEGVSLTVHDCSEIPLYNGDLDGDEKPAAVMGLKQAIADADGLILAVPEYNYSFSGVLKNIIDWASRPAYKSVLVHKPVGMVSAAKGQVGGARGQGQLLQVFSATLTPVVPVQPFVAAMAQNLFSAQGDLTDEVTRQRLQRYLQGYVDWLRQ